MRFEIIKVEECQCSPNSLQGYDALGVLEHLVKNLQGQRWGGYCFSKYKSCVLVHLLPLVCDMLGKSFNF